MCLCFGHDRVLCTIDRDAVCKFDSCVLKEPYIRYELWAYSRLCFYWHIFPLTTKECESWGPILPIPNTVKPHEIDVWAPSRWMGELVRLKHLNTWCLSTVCSKNATVTYMLFLEGGCTCAKPILCPGALCTKDSSSVGANNSMQRGCQRTGRLRKLRSVMMLWQRQAAIGSIVEKHDVIHKTGST